MPCGATGRLFFQDLKSLTGLLPTPARRSAPRAGGARPRLVRHVRRRAGDRRQRQARRTALPRRYRQDEGPSAHVADRPLVAVSRRRSIRCRARRAARPLVPAAAGPLRRRVPRSAGPRSVGAAVVGAGPRAAADGAARRSPRRPVHRPRRRRAVRPRIGRRAAPRSARPADASTDWALISAADPLNLTGIITDGPRIPAMHKNALVIQGGRCVAAKIAGRIEFLPTLRGRSHPAAADPQEPANRPPRPCRVASSGGRWRLMFRESCRNSSRYGWRQCAEIDSVKRTAKNVGRCHDG